MRAAILLLLVIGCDDAAARVRVDDARPFRRPDGFVEVAVDVTGVEQSGGDVGNFCISLHWLPPGTDTGLLAAAGSYFGEADHVSMCTSGLRDGDKKTYHLVSSRADIPNTGLPLRAQASIRDAIDTKDVTSQ